MKYRIEYQYPCPAGAFVLYGGTYRWRWLAEVVAWCAGLLPDAHDYKLVSVEPVEGEDG